MPVFTTQYGWLHIKRVRLSVIQYFELSFGFKKLDVQVIDGGEYFKDIDFITLLILNDTSNSVVKILPFFIYNKKDKYVTF